MNLWKRFNPKQKKFKQKTKINKKQQKNNIKMNPRKTFSRAMISLAGIGIWFQEKDGVIDSVKFSDVLSGSKFDKYRDFKKLNELNSYVSEQIRELDNPLKPQGEQK